MTFSRYFNKYLISKFHPIEVLTYWKSSLSRCGSAAFHLKHCTNERLSSQIKHNIIIYALVEYKTFDQINLAATGLNHASHQMLPQSH